ncbi:MAG: ribosome biogenesis GTP-binding protein YihA/YsxC [Malacoplasma sp.]
MAKFIKSASSIDGWILDAKKEICFLGRSNVGKSSLINALANQTISKTSKTPGRTQLINFFDFNHYRLVDLPGYGYAKISKDKKEVINNFLFEYLSKRENLVGIFQICDAEIITSQDVEIANFISKKFKHHYIILNKIDRLNKSYFDNNGNKISKLLNIDILNLIPVSAKNKYNLNSLISIINKIVD